MMKVSLILDAVNRISGPLGAATRSVERLGAISRAVSRTVGGNFMSMRDFARDATFHFQRMAGPEGMLRAARSASYLKSQFSGVTGALSILKYAAAGAVIGLGEEFVRGVFKVGGDMDRMLVTLTKLEHGAGNARRAMSWMQNDFAFGAGASLSFPDIMKSYQFAKESGMDPQSGSLATMTDLAAAWRVPLSRVLLAVKDAMYGTSSRPLSNLGIKMHSAGGENSFNYQNLAGQWVTETSSKNPASTLASILRIINAKYGGIAAQQARTVPGGIEQIKKLLAVFEAKVWSAGVGQWALSRLNQFFAWVRKASADGSIDRLAKKVSSFITSSGDKLIAFLRETDWATVARNLKMLAISLVALGGAIGVIAKLGGGGLSGLFNLWIASKVIGLARAFYGLWPVIRVGFTILRFLGGLLPWIGRGLLAIFVGMDPIAWVILAVGVAIWALWGKWGKIGAWIAGVWNAIPGAVRTAWGGLKGFFRDLWASISNWQPPSWMRFMAGLVPGAKGLAWVAHGIAGSTWADMVRGGSPQAAPARATGRPLLGRDPYAGTRTTNVGGTMTIEFKNAPPHRVTRLESAHPGFAIALGRGPIKAGD